MDRLTLRRLFNRANPREALSPGDPRCVDLSAVRPLPLLPHLRTTVRRADPPSARLLCAPQGAGVSTALLALAADLHPDATALCLDLRAALDLSAPINLPELLLALTDGAVRALTPDAPSFTARVWSALLAAEPSLSRPEFTVADPRELLSELSLRPALRAHTRALTAARLPDLLAAVRDELRRLDARSRTHHHGPLVLLCDSLEALRPPAHGLRDALQHTESVLARLCALGLPAHLVVTAPVALLTRSLPLDVLPRLPIDTAVGAAHAREILARRLPDGALAEVFAPAPDARVARLIDATCGSPAALVAAAQSLLTEPELPLSERDYDRFLADLTDDDAPPPSAADRPWLARVVATGTLSLADDTDRDRAERALTHGAVLPLPEGRFSVSRGLRERLGL